MKDEKRLYLSIAREVAKQSYAERLKVGAVIVKDNRIISIGYNGTPTGWDNVCEEKYYKIDGRLVDDEGCYDLKTKEEVLHAETNAIAKVAKSSESSEGATLYTTCAPCLQCAKLAYQSGIKKVVFGHGYRSNDGVQFLQRAGVEVEQYDIL